MVHTAAQGCNLKWLGVALGPIRLAMHSAMQPVMGGCIYLATPLVCQAWLPLGDTDVAEDPGVQSETPPRGAQPQTPPAFPPTKHYPREVWGLAK